MAAKEQLICPKCGKIADKMQERNTIVEFFHYNCTIRHVVSKKDVPELLQPKPDRKWSRKETRDSGA